MQLITAVIGLFALTEAIRVPPSWTDTEDVVHNKFRTNGRPNLGSEIGLPARTHVVEKQHKIYSGRKYNRHPNLKNADFKASATSTDWRPIFPTYMEQTPNFKTFYVKNSPTYKNYRDDRTHEPIETEIIHEKHIHREKPLSSHEVPLDIPTRPIYPGEGQWAKKTQKHKPFISKHKFTQPEEDPDDPPAGYETFEKNKKLFERQRDKFRHDIDEFPQRHKLAKAHQYENKEEEDYDEEQEDDDDEEEKQEFVPTRIYTQVRRSEDAEHLPRLVEDPRLREVIKDSKIQTVYTEEGYEDLAYDHAGHEKTAEEDEGYSEFEREIEKEKQKKKLKDSEAEGSQSVPVKRPSKIKKDQLMKSEETKTMVKNDGEMEVVSEIKITKSPTNATKAEKFVRIFPKVYRYDIGAKNIETVSSQKPEDGKTRTKRFTNDFPNISPDTDFIDKINHNLPKIIKIDEKPKYPYYNDQSLNPYSPLRYAEDLDNIPKKTEDELAFYNQADKIECPEVETDVDPIPKRVKNADEDPENADENSDVQELAKSPRLKGLGDKIDCFKVKYFGEDPLDSPFFQEKELGPVLPLFKINAKRGKIDFKPNESGEKGSYSTKIIQKEARTHKQKNEVTEEDLNILNDVINQFNKPKESETATLKSALRLEVVDSKASQSVPSVENQTEASVISIITTPKYTIDLKPKHIYHQIELLQYLPYNNVSKIENVTEAPLNDTSNVQNTTEAPQRIGKSLEEAPTTTTKPTEEAPPESQPLRQRRRRPHPTPFYQVFDVNKYLPQNPYSSLLNQIRSTTFPKRDIRSGMHYKNAIKASDQLNVLADIINNIKNSSRDPQQIAASSSLMPTQLNPYEKYRKIPVVESDLDDIEETNSFYLSTTTEAPRGTIKYTSYTSKEQLFEDLANRDRAKYENLELLKVKRTTTTTVPYPSDNRSSSLSVEDENIEEEEEEEEDSTGTVLGLMPPRPDKYTTIITQATKPSIKEIKVNLFHVLGMKPPSPKQQVYSYSDFKPNLFEKMKFSHLRRGRRSAQRPSYSEVVRNRNKPIDVEDDTEVVVEDDDDYVPHRPKNYHYDENTGRIVYDKAEKEPEAPEEEYIEVTEAPIPKPSKKKSVSAPKFANFTGPSYVDFIKLVKKSANYTEITDPPPTEKNEDDATTTTTTAKPVSTEPPEFLNLLSKVRSVSSYKAITEKTTSKTKTTTQALEEVEEEEEETQLENVQNSPGGQPKGQGFQIFDINEYLPKVKNYSPRTSIDYSKYKTIERAPVPLRHNLSSRYNSEEEELENVKTSRVPILLDDKKQDVNDGEINPVMSESKHEEVEPSTTTTTTTTTESSSTPFPVRRRTRPKSRVTRRTTTSSPVTTPSVPEEPSPATHDKPKRVFPRRRGSRIKISRTTTEVPDAEIEESTSAKVIRRRHQKNEDFSTKAQDRVSTTTETTKPKSAKTQPEQDKKKDGDVQVFQKFNQTKQHGGNYRKEEESESKKVQDVKRLTDVVQKPATYYMDSKLPKKINQLVEGQVDEEDVGDNEEEEGVVGNDDAEADPGYDYEGAEEKGTTTKKPSYVKDPGKRLYYYAPI